MIRHRLLLGIVSVWCVTNAEYIVFKVQDSVTYGPITNENEYKKLYDLLMTYQWPMVIGSSYKLPKQELIELSTAGAPNEEIFLRKKIKSLFPEYDIAYIPTVLYELFVINSISKRYYTLINQAAEFFTSDAGKSLFIQEKEGIALMQDPQATVQSLYDAYGRANNYAKMPEFFRLINNLLIGYCKKLDRLSSVQDALKKQQLTMVQELNGIKNEWPLLTDEVFNNFINFEYEQHAKNLAVLYRGGRANTLYLVGTKSVKLPIETYFLGDLENIKVTYDQLDDLLKNNKKSIPFTPWQRAAAIPSFEGVQNRKEKTRIVQKFLPEINESTLGSVSFGNSLLAGCYFDKEACAAHYFNNAKRLGYALALNKYDYLFGQDRSLIIYSLYNPLLSLFGEGEFFHSRTVSYAPPIFKELFAQFPKFSPLVPGLNIFMMPFDQAGIFLRIGDPLEKAYQISLLVQKNAHVLKLVDGTFFPGHAYTVPYFQAQHDLSDQLKAMLLIRKKIKPQLSVISQKLEKRKKALQQQNVQADKLYWAALSGDSETASALLNQGINTNKKFSHPLKGFGTGNTPLMAAAYYGFENVIQLLLRAGADPALKNDQGFTASDIAQARGHKRIL